MGKPKLTIDPKTGDVYLYLGGEVFSTVELQENPTILVDKDKNGKIVGFEILKN